ncbi:hypothetical protein ACGIF2_06785 [Cellulomonas sp. P22]|uniref:hypothetical protein n=1 Tax=Cellulomonas sp. P22 TaxID=3373189 RepID=UPI00379CDE44
MVRVRPSVRLLAGAGVVALAGAGLAGCSATNQLTTTIDYSASDGVRTELGDLTAENLLIISSAEGAPGALQGALTNNGSNDLDVEVGPEDGETVTVMVPTGSTVLLGGSQGETVTLTTTAPPGAVEALTIETADGTDTVSVPVLDGTLSEYSSLVPTATPTPSATPTAG